MAMLEYGAVPQELVDMSEELEALGGGDTRLASAEVHCRARPARAGAGGIIQEVDGGVAVRDPRVPDNAPPEQAWRRYRLSGYFDEHSTQSQVHAGVGDGVVDWLLEGFSACLIAYGQGMSGKTHTLFGGDSHDDRGLAYRIMEDIWDRTAKDACTMGMSMWEISHDNSVRDCFVEERARGGGEDWGADSAWVPRENVGTFLPVEVEVSKFSDIIEAFDGIVRGNFMLRNSDSVALDAHHRSHIIVRFSLYDTANRIVSNLHFIDVVGSQQKSADDAQAEDFDGAMDCHERQRRNFNAQLLSLNRLISEVSQKGGGGPGDGANVDHRMPSRHLASLRLSSLNYFLGPLIAGNCKKWFVCSADPNPDNHMETMNSLRVMTRAAGIRSACYRESDYDADEVRNGTAGAVLPIAERLAQLKKMSEVSRRESSLVQPRRVVLCEAGAPVHIVVSPARRADRSESDDEPSSSLDRMTTEKDEPHRCGAFAPDMAATTAVDVLEQMGRQYFDGAAAGTTEHASMQEPASDSDVDIESRSGLGAGQASVGDALGVDDLGDRLERLKEEFRDIYATIADDAEQDESGDKSERAAGPRESQTTTASGHAEGVRGLDNVMETAAATTTAVAAPSAANVAFDQRAASRASIKVGQDLEKSQHQALTAAREQIEQLKRENSQVIVMLRRERQMVEHLRKQITENHAENLETNTQYEIALETLRAEAVDLKSKCRQLESETTFSEVFDKYEHEIDDLTSSCRAYRDEIARLRTTIADMSNATQREESDDGADDDARVLQLRRLLRKATSESEKSLETIENLRKQNRHYEFHKKGHEEAFKRISAIQKQLNRKQKECVEVNLMLAERETQIGRLKAEIDRSVDAEARVASENATLVENVRALNEDMESIRMRRRAETLLTKLPTMKLPMSMVCKNHHGCGTPSSQCVALELARRLQREIQQTPRVENTFQRLVKEIQDMQGEREVLEKRELLLVQMLTKATDAKSAR